MKPNPRLLVTLLLMAPCGTPAPAEAQSAPHCTNVRDYGARGDGQTDDSAAIQAAVTASSHVCIPSGKYSIASTIGLHWGITLEGADAASTVLYFKGTGDALSWQQSRARGQVSIRNLTFEAVGATDGAALDLQGWAPNGSAFFDVAHVAVRGPFRYGVILNGIQVTSLHHSIIQNRGQVNVWIVYGPEHSLDTGSSTNILTISDNQFNAGEIGILDDGGDGHAIMGNNFNAIPLSIRVCDTSGLVIMRNTFENHTPQGATDVLITDTASSGIFRGVNRGGVIQGNTFDGTIAAGGSLLTFASGSGFHEGFSITGNVFSGSVLGRHGGGGGAVDVSRLRWSFVGNNADTAAYTDNHFSGAHDDENGNVLFPPGNTHDGTVFDFGRPDAFYGFSGSVGVGTNVPARGLKLDAEQNLIDGYTAQFRNSAGVRGHGILIWTGDASARALDINSGAVYLYGNGNAYFAGKVGVGGGNPQDMLDVVGNISVAGCIRDEGHGVVYAGVCLSASRSELSVRPLVGALAKLSALNPVSFGPEGPKSGVARGSGLLAPEVAKVFPGWVSTDKEGHEYISYGTIEFQMLMLAAIKELHGENLALRRKVARLERGAEGYKR